MLFLQLQYFIFPKTKAGMFKKNKLIIKLKQVYKKLTLFDQILAGIAVFGILFFAYTFSRHASFVTITLKVGADNTYYSIFGPGIPTWYDNFFYKGMSEKNGLGTVQAEVLDINSFYKWPQTLSVYAKVRLRVTYNRASDQFTYKGTPVVIGSRLKLYLNNVLVEGLITGVDGVKDPREKKTLIAETRIIDHNSTFLESSGTDQFLADTLNVGDEIKDLQGNTVIKIISKRVEPAKKVTTASDGSLLTQLDPIRKDVYVNLELNTTKVQGHYFIFDDIPILVGQAVPLNTSTTSIYTTITKIVENK